jgi:hypothetical protein
MLVRNLNDRSPRTMHEVGTMHEVARLFSGRDSSAVGRAPRERRHGHACPVLARPSVCRPPF